MTRNLSSSTDAPADSPEIDGRVWIAAQEPLHEGEFVLVTMDGTQDGDLTGYVAEEAEE